jgi:ectoine hydroxylase-related dioxygenase (phytanoyl-CoA dioxygenase family)
MQQKEKLNEDGYIILREFFSPEYIIKIREKAKEIFTIQFDKFGYNGSYDENMIRLFRDHEDVFINCGKIIQTGLIELYELPTNPKLISLIKELGLEFPNLCTRPVLYFNHPNLAKDVVYYKTPPHQDYPSMLSSSDSIVIWVPLVDVDEHNGSIIIWPKTHKNGTFTYKNIGGFASVEVTGDSVQPRMSVGDIAIFSTFLVHSSGEITNNTIRWSCHYRYTNMYDNDFIDRGFPNPYIYKPITKNEI